MSVQPSQLQSRLISMLDRAAIEKLSIDSGIADTETVKAAATLLSEPVLEGLHEMARSEKGSAVLSDILERTPKDGVDGAKLTGYIFTDRLPETVQGVATRYGLTEAQSTAAVEATSVWTLTTASSMVGDPQSLPRMLASRGVVSTTSAAAENRSEAQSASMPTKASTGVSGKLIGAALAALLVIGGGIFALTSGGGDESPTVDVATQQPATQAEPTDPESATSADAAPPTLAATTDPAESDEQDTTTAAAETADAADTSAETTADDGTVVAAAATTESEMVSPTLTSLSVPMRDIRDTSSDASGVLDFTFDTLTGQICYEVGSLGVNPPHAAHIHAGDFGIKGGVVADLGMLDNGSTGCIDNLPADTMAILATPSRHYAELHDASGEWTVRGQLSETADKPGIVPVSIPMRDILGTSPSSSGVLNFNFNTLTGEICYSVFAVGVEPPFNSHIHAGGFGVKGGVVLDMGALDSGAEGCVQNKLSDTIAILSNPAGHYAEIHDVSGDWTVRGQLTETIDSPGIVSLGVPMVDIKNVEPTAAGTLAFDFNTVTGEICYDVSATNISAPFASHIHAGDYGIKGGVVVDLGGLEDGSSGCVSNNVADTLAILADPSGHYAELHDSSGDWTIRGQLSEASAAIDPNLENLLIDTDGGGAFLRLENGQIFLEGDVASQEVADEMASSLAGINTPVVNNLKVVAGAPVPSGRVVIADTIFFDTGSDRIKDIDPTTIRALVELANSRPEWVMAIVGHTDNVGSEVANLELSLRRAEALRAILVAQGMNSENMRIRGAGETAPIADNATEAGRAQNRRIEFEFTPA